MRWRKIAGVLVLVLLLVGCTDGGESRVSVPGKVSYQIREPKVYCHEIQTDLGFDLYCPEGRISTEFVPVEGEFSLEQERAKILDEIFQEASYTMPDWKEERSIIDLTEWGPLPESTDLRYLAVFPFKSGYLAVVKGFLYNDEKSFVFDFSLAYNGSECEMFLGMLCRIF
jgi:hypothetical protein